MNEVVVGAVFDLQHPAPSRFMKRAKRAAGEGRREDLSWARILLIHHCAPGEVRYLQPEGSLGWE